MFLTTHPFYESVETRMWTRFALARFTCIGYRGSDDDKKGVASELLASIGSHIENIAGLR